MRGHFRNLLALFGLTPKSKRRLAASESLDATPKLVAVKGRAGHPKSTWAAHGILISPGEFSSALKS